MRKWLVCLMMLAMLGTCFPAGAEELQVQQTKGQRVETWMKFYITEDVPQWLMQLLNALTIEAYEQPDSSGYRLLKDDEVLLQMDFLREGNVRYTQSNLFDGSLAVASDALLPTLASVVTKLGEMDVLDAVTADVICRFLLPESEDTSIAPFDPARLDLSALQNALTALQTDPIRTEAPEDADYAYSLSYTFTPAQVNDLLTALDSCLSDNWEELQKLENAGGLLSMARMHLMQLRLRAFLELKEPVTVCMYYDYLYDEAALATSGLAFYMAEYPDLVAMELHLGEGRVVRAEHTVRGATDEKYGEVWNLYESNSNRPEVVAGACYQLERIVRGQMEDWYFRAGEYAAAHMTVHVFRKVTEPLPSPIDTASALRIDLLDADALTSWVEGAVTTVRGWLDILRELQAPKQSVPVTNP